MLANLMRPQTRYNNNSRRRALGGGLGATPANGALEVSTAALVWYSEFW